MGDRQQIAVTVLMGGLGSVVAGIALIAVDQQAVDHRWGYALVALGVLIILIGGVMWLSGSSPRERSTDVRAEHGSTAAGGNIQVDHGAIVGGNVHIGTLHAAPVMPRPRSVDAIIRQLRSKSTRDWRNEQFVPTDSASVFQRCADDLGTSGIRYDSSPILGTFQYEMLPQDFLECLDHWQLLGLVERSDQTFTYYLTDLGHQVAQQLNPAPRAPSFDLSHQPAADGWVHLRLDNLVAEPSLFHVEVTDIANTREPQTTPYLVHWRDTNVEDRRVVTSALINLAQFIWHPAPDINADGGGVFFVKVHGHMRGGWDSGYTQFFSFSQPKGWVVESRDFEPDDPSANMPAHVRLFFEEIALTVKVTRIDPRETRSWRVTLGFTLPTFNDAQQRWVLPSPVEGRVTMQEVH